MAFNAHLQRLNRIQKGAVERAVELLEEKSRCLIVMTTGTGKTMVGCKVMAEYPKARVLWLTQTEELIMQTANDLKRYFGANKVGLFRRNVREIEEAIVVGSLQSLEKDESLELFGARHFDLMVVDEAHHSRAASWEKVIRHFRCKKLGLTATPYRHDGKGLKDLFGEAAFEMSYEEAKSYRLIAEETYRVILTNSQIEGVVTRSGEYKPNALDRLVVSQNRNEIIVESYKKYGRSFMRENGLPYKTLCFCISVRHALHMRDLFRKHSIASEILVGKTGKNSAEFAISHRPQTERERREIFKTFSETDQIEILCVVNVMNEGKNIPTVGCLLMTRPTRSGIIFQQQLGRGCRFIEGVKEKYLVLDFVDLLNRKFPPMTLSKFTGKDYPPEEIVTEYYRGKDPIVINEYVEYLSKNYQIEPDHVWTKTAIVKALKRYYWEHEKIVWKDLVTEKTGLPGPTVIRRYWPSVTACFEAIGLPAAPQKKAVWTKESAEAAIRLYVERGGSFRIVHLQSGNGLPSKKIVEKYWGSIKQCADALGINDRWTRAKILEGIQAFRKKKGRNPTKDDFAGKNGLPTVKTVRRFFGKMSEAIEGAR